MRLPATVGRSGHLVMTVTRVTATRVEAAKTVTPNKPLKSCLLMLMSHSPIHVQIAVPKLIGSMRTMRRHLQPLGIGESQAETPAGLIDFQQPHGKKGVDVIGQTPHVAPIHIEIEQLAERVHENHPFSMKNSRGQNLTHHAKDQNPTAKTVFKKLHKLLEHQVVHTQKRPT
ncbi:hypothetical protein [Cynomolgus macaque cytomegalovirus strain Mauritius]|uniref:Uncharacterized protein n=1 Tax=Cynomolgus macaque cytomegalovirus strain Mauritius TaxID=1690255 RepID=A0A0K1H0J1_9BETA|nr:hypothetical protein [Cynomolgus macaque cytomegalovirus strain Mauritius]AXG21946.1 hypothetical protein [synthetic construct]AXG22216.1 hypothetical protein [synthetic construct]